MQKTAAKNNPPQVAVSVDYASHDFPVEHVNLKRIL